MSQINDIVLNFSSSYDSAPAPSTQLRTAPSHAQSAAVNNVHPMRSSRMRVDRDRPSSRHAKPHHQSSRNQDDHRSNETHDSDRPVAKAYQPPRPMKVLPQLAERQSSDLSHSALQPLATGQVSTAAFSDAVDFSQFGLEPRLTSALTNKLHLTRPTHIQSLSIPSMLSPSNLGRDFCIQSLTGAGKTLSYLIPILHALVSPHVRLHRSSGVRVIILLPTRELCMQVEQVLSTLLLSYHWLVATSLMGGESLQSEKARLRKGCNCIVATPGRMLDHLQHTESLRKHCHSVRWIVLDEADRMQSMGFKQDIQEIVKQLNQAAKESRPLQTQIEPQQRRQVVLVSATLDKSTESLVDGALHEPVYIGFDNQSAAADQSEDKQPIALPPTLSQHFLQVESRHRLVALASLLRQQTLLAKRSDSICKIVVFASTCASVDLLSRLFEHACSLDTADADDQPAADDGESTAAKRTALLILPLFKLHGSLPQALRTSTYSRFVKSSSAILIATDVACRGLDLPSVTHVVQYDAPESLAAYAHRAGRTARLGRQGKSILFAAPHEMPYIELLSDAGLKLQELQLPRILSALRLSESGAVIQLQSRMPGGALLQRQFESMVSGQPDLHSLACDAYASYIRSYSAYPRNIKSIFHPRALHLGHVARSFGLTEEPKKAVKQSSSAVLDNERRKKRKAQDREIEHQVELTAQAEAQSHSNDAATQRTELNKRKRAAQIAKRMKTDEQFNTKQRTVGADASTSQSEVQRQLIASAKASQIFARHKPNMASEFAA